MIVKINQPPIERFSYAPDAKKKSQFLPPQPNITLCDNRTRPQQSYSHSIPTTRKAQGPYRVLSWNTTTHIVQHPPLSPLKRLTHLHTSMARTVLPRYGRNRSNNRATQSRTELSPASNASSSTHRVRGNACGWNSPSTNADCAIWTASDIAKLEQQLVGRTGGKRWDPGRMTAVNIDGGEGGNGLAVRLG